MKQRSQPTRTLRCVIGFVLGGLVFAACGGDGDDGQLLPVGGATPTVIPVAPDDDAQTETATTPGTPLQGGVVIDSFDASSDRSLATGDIPWATLSGIWGSTNGSARITQPAQAGAPNIVVTPGAANGSAHVTFTVVGNQAALVFRLVDVDNYWAVVAAPPFATWNVIRVVDGEAEQAANLGVSPVVEGTTVGVIVDDDDIIVTINGRIRLTLTDPTHADGAWYGLGGFGPGALEAQWDEFVAVTFDESFDISEMLPTPTVAPIAIPTPTPSGVGDSSPTPTTGSG